MKERAVRIGKEPGTFEFIYTPEAEAQLEMLQASPAWQTYRKFLIDLKMTYLEHAMSEKDTNELFKRMGIAAGLNLAINQLDLSVLQIKNKAKRGVGDTEKPN